MRVRELDWKELPHITEALIEAWYKGVSTSKIAKDLSLRYDIRITKNMVVGRAHRLDLPQRPSPIQIGAKRREGGRPKKLKQTENGRRWALPSRPAPEPQPLPPQPDIKQEPAFLALRRAAIPIGFRECQWPVSEGRPHVFCGEPTCRNAGGSRSPYCEKHQQMARAKVQVPKPACAAS